LLLNKCNMPDTKGAGVTVEHVEKRSGEGNVDIRFQVQLEEDGGSRTYKTELDGDK